MQFKEWLGEVYLPTRQKMSTKVLAKSLPTEPTVMEYEFQVLPPMADKAAELRREATKYYRDAKLAAEMSLEAEKYPRSSLASLAKDRCGEELAVMQEAEDLLSIIRERRFDVKKLKFGHTERDT